MRRYLALSRGFFRVLLLAAIVVAAWPVMPAARASASALPPCHEQSVPAQPADTKADMAKPCADCAMPCCLAPLPPRVIAMPVPQEASRVFARSVFAAFDPADVPPLLAPPRG